MPMFTNATDTTAIDQQIQAPLANPVLAAELVATIAVMSTGAPAQASADQGMIVWLSKLAHAQIKANRVGDAHLIQLHPSPSGAGRNDLLLMSVSASEVDIVEAMRAH